MNLFYQVLGKENKKIITNEEKENLSELSRSFAKENLIKIIYLQKKIPIFLFLKCIRNNLNLEI